MRRKISNILILLGIVIALYPLYQLGYTYYWQEKLMDDFVSLDGLYQDNQESYEINPEGFFKQEEESLRNQELIEDSLDNLVEKTTAEPQPVAPTETVNEPKPIVENIKVMGTITIPKIDLKMAILDGITESNLNRGAAWMSESGVIGQNGNAVIAGHRGYTRGRLFNRLDEIVINDTFTIKTKEGSYNYVVYDVQIVLPTETSVLSQPRNKEIVTLITCTPLFKSTHRIIIKAKRY
jgi:sortase A